MKQIELMVRATGFVLVDVPDDKMAEFEAAMRGLPTPAPLERLSAIIEFDPGDLMNDLEFTVVDYDLLDDVDDEDEAGDREGK